MKGRGGKTGWKKTLGDGDGDEGRKILEPAVPWANGLSLEQKDGFYGFGWWGAEGTLKYTKIPSPPSLVLHFPLLSLSKGCRNQGKELTAIPESPALLPALLTLFPALFQELKGHK